MLLIHESYLRYTLLFMVLPSILSEQKDVLDVKFAVLDIFLVHKFLTTLKLAFYTTVQHCTQIILIIF